jgi:hypothetical protein
MLHRVRTCEFNKRPPVAVSNGCAVNDSIETIAGTAHSNIEMPLSTHLRLNRKDRPVAAGRGYGPEFQVWPESDLHWSDRHVCKGDIP